VQQSGILQAASWRTKTRHDILDTRIPTLPSLPWFETITNTHQPLLKKVWRERPALIPDVLPQYARAALESAQFHNVDEDSALKSTGMSSLDHKRPSHMLGAIQQLDSYAQHSYQRMKSTPSQLFSRHHLRPDSKITTRIIPRCHEEARNVISSIMATSAR